MAKSDSVNCIDNSNTDFRQLLLALPRMHSACIQSAPIQSAVFRFEPEDFLVREQLGFDASREGDHLLLHIQKQGVNTQDVLDQLMRRFGVKSVDLGYCGLKDKHAVTDQWISVHLPGRTLQALQGLEHDDALIAGCSHPSELAHGIRLLSASRHHRKLRIGSHRANQFTLILRDLQGDVTQLQQRFLTLEQTGIPNYFGEQRFGHQARNLYRVQSWFAELLRIGGPPTGSRTVARQRQRVLRKLSRRQRSLYLSAARAFLFNMLLGARVDSGNWLTPLPDEPLMLEGSRSIFTGKPDDLEKLTERIKELDIHTTGALWGRAGAQTTHALYEEDVLRGYTEMLRGLEVAGVDAARRALRVVPRQLSCKRLSTTSVQLAFELPAGAYATALLRELVVDLQNANRQV